MLLAILPSGLFLVACIRLRWFEWLNRPIDAGLHLFGEPLFGANKNWRGLVIYTFGGGASVWLLHQLANQSDWVAPVFRNDPWPLGFTWGFSYAIGELVNSFIKRRFKVAAGTEAKSSVGKIIQRFFDNVDGILATGFILVLVYHVEAPYLICSFVLGYLAHASVELLMKRFRLKK